MEATSSSSKMYLYKGKLITYATTHGFDKPDYQFESQGLPHELCFRATVHVAGQSFSSPETFSRRKDAEHFISKLAFESLSTQTQPNVPSISFLQGSKLCKTILHEYSVRKGQLDLPSYNTKVPESGPSTVFVSEIELDNKTFVGPLSKSKKEAEQNAARFVINSLLENSETRCLMSEVIKKFAPATAESGPNPNPNPDCDAVSQVDSAQEPVQVTEANPPVFPQCLIANNTFKSILKEYGDKKGIQDVPVYKIYTQESGPPLKFVSTVSFEGNTYYGPLMKSKKEAEQAAARVAIDSILGNPVSKKFMLQAMQSKIELQPSLDVNLISNPSANPNPDQVNTPPEQVSTNLKAKQVADSSIVSVESLPSVKSSVGQSEEIKVENLSGVGPSKSARKRARKKEKKREAKKVKME
ncbi:uncharacterized protein LOC144549207 [Carex rostrata]